MLLLWIVTKRPQVHPFFGMMAWNVRKLQNIQVSSMWRSDLTPLLLQHPKRFTSEYQGCQNARIQGHRQQIINVMKRCTGPHMLSEFRAAHHPPEAACGLPHVQFWVPHQFSRYAKKRVPAWRQNGLFEEFLTSTYSLTAPSVSIQTVTLHPVEYFMGKAYTV